MTFNPYSGCDHHCVYCYASSYVRDFHSCRPKKDKIRILLRESKKLKGEVVSMSNSSDPYPRMEASLGWTRRCLEVFAQADCKIQIVTKSNLVTRDEDLLRKMQAIVAITITTKDDILAGKMEPYAPLPSVRLRAVKDLLDAGIPTSVRIDPIIPKLNDKTDELVAQLAKIGVKHITCSTYKLRLDNWKRFSEVFPDLASKLVPFYFNQGERIGGSIFLPKKFRFMLLQQIKDNAESCGVRFGVCRENLNKLNSAPCDGSWLLSEL